ncbi:transcriptional regulator [uncultured Clostridium sp.]|jgi:DNA-binding MarR family transcriptional regulator|uniref:transcriptional regulator n=1 Tax=uncultured Clostridium sp. TaxID=59620 RepID=UPI0026334C4B|nr:transcriptional regulator [uncultured Clostridium sp.]MCI9110289.1 MarR family transcriptional regulator [Bacilli bacterium]
MRVEYIEYLTNLEISSQAFRVLLALNIKEYTQSQVRKKLNIQDKAQVNKLFKDLIYKGLIEVTKVEGRNKFYRAITDVKSLKVNIPGQQKMF